MTFLNGKGNKGFADSPSILRDPEFCEFIASVISVENDNRTFG